MSKKSFKILESNHSPSAAKPTTTPCPQVPHPSSKSFQGWGYQHHPGQPVLMSDHFSEEIVPNVQYKLPLALPLWSVQRNILRMKK